MVNKPNSLKFEHNSGNPHQNSETPTTTLEILSKGSKAFKLKSNNSYFKFYFLLKTFNSFDVKSYELSTDVCVKVLPKL